MSDLSSERTLRIDNNHGKKGKALEIEEEFHGGGVVLLLLWLWLCWDAFSCR